MAVVAYAQRMISPRISDNPIGYSAGSFFEFTWFNEVAGGSTPEKQHFQRSSRQRQVPSRMLFRFLNLEDQIKHLVWQFVEIQYVPVAIADSPAERGS